jgi:Jacalin-like lectin domain
MSLPVTKPSSSSIDPPATGDGLPGYRDQIRNHAAAVADTTASTADTTATADQHRQRTYEERSHNLHQSSTTRSKTDVGPSYKDQMRGALVVETPLAVPLAEATPVTGSRLQLEQQNLELQQELVVRQQQQQQPADSSSNGSCSLSKTQCIGIAVGVALILAAAVTVMAVVCATGNCGGRTPPLVMPTAAPFPSSQQASTPVPTEPIEFLYTQSIIVPNMTTNFDHMQEFGYSPNNSSRMDKMSQIKVFRTDVCLGTNGTCAPTRLVLSLVVTYFLCDGSVFVKTQGAYTDRNPFGTINFRNDTYITRIELSADEKYIIGIKICTTNEGCYGPYGDLPELEPNTTIFEMPNSTIKAFYGYSGSWVDALGVYYEPVALSGLDCS